MPLQGELNFQLNGTSDGHAGWLALRQLSVEKAAEKLNLPLGHQTEVWLRHGIRLRGKLRLVNEVLFVEEDQLRKLPLILDGITFTHDEIESCLRVD
jgi:hypothetical protein